MFPRWRRSRRRAAQVHQRQGQHIRRVSHRQALAQVFVVPAHVDGVFALIARRQIELVPRDKGFVGVEEAHRDSRYAVALPKYLEGRAFLIGLREDDREDAPGAADRRDKLPLQFEHMLLAEAVGVQADRFAEYCALARGVIAEQVGVCAGDEGAERQGE